MIDFRKLVKAGVHFGHQSSRWSPRMAPYIWGKKNGVHLIDVSKTALNLEKAAKFLEETAKQGKNILWVGTKKPAQKSVQEAGLTTNMPSVTHRWIGGTLTNNLQVKKSITKFLHLQDVLKRSEDTHYTKKELNSFQKRVDRLEKNIGGIVSMKWPVGALVVVDARKEASAVKEAAAMNIPVVSLVDTNTSPLLISHVIPANDDSPKSIQVLVEYLAQATAKGKQAFEEEQKEASEARKLIEAEAKKSSVKKTVLKKEAATAVKKVKAEDKKSSVKKAEPDVKPATTKEAATKTVSTEKKK